VTREVRFARAAIRIRMMAACARPFKRARPSTERQEGVSPVELGVIMRSISLMLFVASLAWTQGPSAPPEGKDERVQVVLRNGHSLIGIAKSGMRSERLVNGKFKPSTDPTDPRTGIRVWYYQDLDGYIFVEQKALERVDVLGSLTTDESKALSDAVAAARGARAHVVAAAASRPARKEGDPAPESKPATDLDGYTAVQKSILERFPPEKGWNPEKFGELQRRKIVLHVNPSNEEQAFIDEFPTFQEAWQRWLAAHPKSEEAPKSEEKAPHSKK
jgi:hypothetical protein